MINTDLNDPCINPSISFSGSLTRSHTYLLGNEEDTYLVPEVDNTSGCSVTYTASVESHYQMVDTSFFTENENGRGFSWQTSDLSHIGTYAVTVTANSGCSSIQETYTVEVVESCQYSTSAPVLTNPGNQQESLDYHYTGSNPVGKFTMNPFTVSPSDCTITYECATQVGSDNSVQIDLCVIENADGIQTSSFDSSTGDLKMQFTDTEAYPPGTYTLSLTARVEDDPYYWESIELTVNLIHPCETATLTHQNALFPADRVDYTIGDDYL